jgi:hypothetical protein
MRSSKWVVDFTWVIAAIRVCFEQSEQDGPMILRKPPWVQFTTCSAAARAPTPRGNLARKALNPLISLAAVFCVEHFCGVRRRAVHVVYLRPNAL